MKIADTSVPVCVVRLFQQGGIGIARSLGRLGIPVYGMSEMSRDPATFSRYCRETFIWDIHKAPPAESVRFLLEVGRKIGHRSILIPTSDPATLFVDQNAEVLREWFLFPHRSFEVMRSLVSKKGMYLLCKKFGIPTAETAFPQSRYDVVNFLKGATYPIMLKGIEGYLLEERTGKRMVVVQNERQLLEMYDRMEDPREPNLMLQEYIPGDDNSVWMFNGYFNEQAECLASFTGQKLRQYPAHAGATSLGICLANEIVDNTTKKFMKAVGYRGIVDIGYRYDARDGRYKLLDVNPRIGATFRLFVGNNGLDVVRALYLDLTGQPAPPTTLRPGRKWLVENNDLFTFRDYHHDGKLTLFQWVRSLRGIQETAWFALDDWVPFFAVCLELGKRLLRLIYKRALAREKRVSIGSMN